MLIRGGETDRGLALLDEVMLSVTAGEVSAAIAGTVYCSVIEACFEICDLGRAQEWTGALTDWCASQPDVVPYGGHCLVRPAEIMLLHGVWPGAIDGRCARAIAFARLLNRQSDLLSPSASSVCSRSSRKRKGPIAAPARPADAHPPARVTRLAQGRVDAAGTAICVISETAEIVAPVRRFAACVEIQLTAGDPAAKSAAQDLAALEAAFETPYHALSSGPQAPSGWRKVTRSPRRGLRAGRRGSGAARGAVVRPAPRRRWLAYRALAIRHRAMALEAARRAFEAARWSLTSGAEQLAAPADRPPAGGLTTRELQVLRLVAHGKSNRAIAGELGISDKTVARHMSNIFTKLDLSSRAAATAYAFKLKLV
jgi:DNA-binding CsgD family transcriptional regulator